MTAFSTVNAQSYDEELWAEIDSLNDQAYSVANIDLDSAEVLVDRIFQIFEEPYDILVYSKVYTLKGILDFQKADYQSSIEAHFRSLSLREEYDPSSLHAATGHKNLANVYYYTNAYDNALEHLNKSIKIKKGLDSTENVLTDDYNLMALILWEKDQLDSAEYYFERGLMSLDSSEESDAARARLLSNLAGLSIEAEDYEKAEQLLKSGAALRMQEGESLGLSWNYMRLGSLYNQMGKYREAERSLRTADSLSLYSTTYETQSDIKYFLFQSFLMRKETDSAQKYILEFMKMNDSLVSQKTKENIQEMAAKYELERNATLLELAEEESARFAEENKNQRILLFIAVIGLVILIGMIFFLRYLYNQKRKLSLMELQIKDNKLDELMSAQESKTYSAMLKGQQEERDRIARDLHDRLGGTLAALKHSLRRPGNKISDEDLEIVDLAVQEVRSVSHNLSSSTLADYGLSEALKQLKKTIESAGNVKFNTYLHPSTAQLKQEVTLSLYRVIQELVSNTLKHAQATEISVQTNFDKGVFNMIYEDNGRGFDSSKAKRGMGLDNMRARIKKLNGNLHIDTELGRGTIAIVELNEES